MLRSTAANANPRPDGEHWRDRMPTVAERAAHAKAHPGGDGDGHGMWQTDTAGGRWAGPDGEWTEASAAAIAERGARWFRPIALALVPVPWPVLPTAQTPAAHVAAAHRIASGTAAHREEAIRAHIAEAHRLLSAPADTDTGDEDAPPAPTGTALFCALSEAARRLDATHPGAAAELRWQAADIIATAVLGGDS